MKNSEWKCEHDKGDHWLSYEENNFGVKIPLRWEKTYSETCPFCPSLMRRVRGRWE